MKRNMGCREDVNLNCFDASEDLHTSEEVGIFFLIYSLSGPDLSRRKHQKAHLHAQLLHLVTQFSSVVMILFFPKRLSN